MNVVGIFYHPEAPRRAVPKQQGDFEVLLPRVASSKSTTICLDMVAREDGINSKEGVKSGTEIFAEA